MCGIVGIICGSSSLAIAELSTVIRTMTDVMRHRGPESSGYWVACDKAVALGHRRLAIVDLSPAGHQPMASSSGRWKVVLNGEIYNYRDLANELSIEGVSFTGSSDTEVLVAAIENWGIRAALRKCNGMFALAAWDSEFRELVLARDRMGEKPLYYGLCGGDFVFSSELKALVQHPAWSGVIDKEALQLYLRYGYVPAPNSIYKGIAKLEPGTITTISGDEIAEGRFTGGVVHSYWSLDNCVKVDPVSRKASELIKGLDQQLHETISDQMLADVPLGAFLSGGVDSSVVTAIMQAESSLPINTFTIGFEEQEFNEAGFSKDVAKHLGTDHTELYIQSKEVMDVIGKLPHLYDEPFADSSQLPAHVLCTMAKQHVTVCLSGDGGDELFCGYNRYVHAEKVWNAIKYLPCFARSLLAGVLNAMSPVFFDRIIVILTKVLPSLGSVKTGNSMIKIQKLANVLAAENFEGLYQLLVSYCIDPDAILLGPAEQVYVDPAGLASEWASKLDYMMYRDQLTYLRDDNLVKMDRAAMGVSLEIRLPLLDHRVVEYAWQVPLEFKLRENKSKWLLRQVLYQYVPVKLIERPKMGFSVPMAQWLRGPLRDWGEELLAPTRIILDGLFDATVVARFWREHLDGRRDHSMTLWALLVFQDWYQQNRRIN